MAAVNNLLNLLGVPPFSQQIVKGLIILGAVLLERRARGKDGEAGEPLMRGGGNRHAGSGHADLAAIEPWSEVGGT